MKAILAWAALTLAALFILAFAWAIARELLRDLQLRRSRRTVLIQAPYVVRPEWLIKDPPAWERLPAHKTWRLRAGLRELGQ